MNKATAILTRAYSSNVAQMAQEIAARECIDLNSVVYSYVNQAFIIGEQKTGLFLSISTKKYSRIFDLNNTCCIKLAFDVSTPKKNYREFLYSDKADSIKYKGSQLEARPMTGFLNAAGHALTGHGIWSVIHNGFISFENKLHPYEPAGERAACEEIAKSGLVLNADLFICKVK